MTKDHGDLPAPFSKSSIYVKMAHAIFTKRFCFSVQTIHHDRMTLPSYVYKTEVSCTVEIRNTKHCEELRTALFQEYGSSLRWSSG